MTTAASVASGISAMTPESRIIVTSVPPAVTSSESCVRAPAWRFTAVWVVPPPAGMAPSRAPPTFASPVANNSRFAFVAGSSARAKARPAAIVSVKLINAIATAPSQSCLTREVSGKVKEGRPRGMCPTSSTPRVCSPRKADPAIPTATATSGAGAWGKKRSIPTRIAIMTSPTARVGSDVLDSPSKISSTL